MAKKKLTEHEEQILQHIADKHHGIFHTSELENNVLMREDDIQVLLDKKYIKQIIDVFGTRYYLNKNMYLKFTRNIDPRTVRVKTKDYLSIKTKKEVATKYHDLLNWVNGLTSGWILESHLLVYLKEFGSADAEESIKEMLKNNILSQAAFNGQVAFKLSKYAVRYLKEIRKGKTLQAKDVSSVKISDSTMLVNTIKSAFIIKEIIPEISTRPLSSKLLKDEILKRNSSIMCTANRTAWYLRQAYEYNKNINYPIHYLKDYYKKANAYEKNQKDTLKYATHNSSSKKSNIENKKQSIKDKLENVTLSTLCRKNIFISNISFCNDYQKVKTDRDDIEIQVDRTAIIDTVMIANPGKSYRNFEIKQLIEDIAILKRYVRNNYIATSHLPSDKGKVTKTFGYAKINLKVLCKDKQQLANIQDRLYQIVYSERLGEEVSYLEDALYKIYNVTNVSITTDLINLQTY